MGFWSASTSALELDAPHFRFQISKKLRISMSKFQSKVRPCRGGVHLHRTRRLEEILREELQFLLESEVCDPELNQLKLLRVELVRRGACANVWVNPGATGRAGAISSLLRARGFLRYRLSTDLDLKRTPELRFFLEDESMLSLEEGV